MMGGRTGLRTAQNESLLCSFAVTRLRTYMPHTWHMVSYARMILLGRSRNPVIEMFHDVSSLLLRLQLSPTAANSTLHY